MVDPSLPLVSGGLLSSIGVIGMVFVPCRDGISHAPEEWADAEHIALGADTIATAISSLDDCA